LRERIQVGDHSAMFRAFFYDLQRCLDDPSGVPRCVFDSSSMRPPRLLGHSSMHHRRLFSDFSSESSANLSSEKLSGSSVCTNRHEQVASDPSVELFSCVLREIFRASSCTLRTHVAHTVVHISAHARAFLVRTVYDFRRISYIVSGALRTTFVRTFRRTVRRTSGTLSSAYRIHCQAHFMHIVRRTSYALS